MPKLLSILVLAVLSLGAKPALAQFNPLYRATVYVAPMVGNLDVLIASEIVRKNVPVILTQDAARAEYILRGPVPADSLPEKAAAERSLTLVDAHSHAIVWAAAVSANKGSERKIAGCLVARFRRDFFAGPSLTDRLDDFLHP